MEQEQKRYESIVLRGREAAVLHGKREIACTAHALQQVHSSE